MEREKGKRIAFKEGGVGGGSGNLEQCQDYWVKTRVYGAMVFLRKSPKNNESK